VEAGALIGGKYRVSRRIGEGAMGVVWAAVNELTERDVALKLIARHGLPVDMLKARLLREARACGRISHRNVVEILDVGQTDRGDPFLVMPLLLGETLKDRIRRDGRLPPLEAARIMAEVARGLASAHAAGIVHRDLKPANIFLHQEPDRAEPAVKVLDFGVSKIVDAEDVSTTSIGVALGSPSYMSPEQVSSHRTIDHRTDLWTLGVVLYEAIAGERPFQGTAPVRVMADVLGATIPDLCEVAPGVDRRLGALVQKCLERDLARRIASATEVVAVLDLLCEEAWRQSPGARLVRPVPQPALPPDEQPTRQLRAADDPSTESDAKTLLFAPSTPGDTEPVEQPVTPQPDPLRARMTVFIASGAAAGAAVAVIGAILIASGSGPVRAMAGIQAKARPMVEQPAPPPPDAPPPAPTETGIAPVPVADPAPAPVASVAPRSSAHAPARSAAPRPRPDAVPRPKSDGAAPRPKPLDLPTDPG
jgi:serine/threonine-protein kinase